MTVSIKDGLKLFGIMIVFGCAVFVCTFFLNFHLDALSVRDLVSAEAMPLYEAQLLSSKLTCLISGLCLLLVSVVLIVFYIKLYLDAHAKQIGILKALGVSDMKIASGFWVFGLSVLLGGAIGFGGGYAFAPLVYSSMDGEGLPEIALRFHGELLFFLVILPFVCFSVFAIVYAFLKLRLPVSALLRGKEVKNKKMRTSKKERTFLTEMFFGSLKSRPALAFFVAFACFCFAAMLQMGFSMRELASDTMGITVAAIGVVLAACSLLLSMTMLVRSNADTIALMRACGYRLRDYWAAVLGGYHIPAFIGFAVGTVYQYGLLKLMLTFVYSSVEIPEYSFDYVVFGVVLAAFVVLYELTTFLFTLSARKISVRELATE
ncbi:MAG: FtsX-like permease family protein [Clostridiales bacterium]|nr:FtsX-like permease family protein [Clostridiales bacterium]